MIKEFKKLTTKEQNLLIKAPALVSVLAASGSFGINNEQKAEAIRMAHLKTYTANPLLLPYYAEVETCFTKNFEATVKKYAPFDDAKRELLKKEISLTNQVIAKLDKEFAISLHLSLEGYANHVKKTARSFFENFIFPIPIKGLTDK